MEDFAQDMADDIQELRLMPKLESADLSDISETISREMFQLSMDYIEQPERREQICVKAEKMITALIMGSAVLHGHGPVVIGAL